MTGSGDDDPTKDRKDPDKTVIRFAGSGQAAWPGDPEVPENRETGAKADAEDDGKTQVVPIQVADRPAEAAEGQTSAASDDLPVQPAAIEASPPVGTVQSPFPETETPEAGSAEAASGENPQAGDDDQAALRDTGSPPVSTETTDDDGVPPEAPRIELPVQQQYASLLAALSERIEHHPGGHDLLAVLRMLEGQTSPAATASGTSRKKSDEPAPPRIGKSRRMLEDIVRFGQDPSSEFAPSTIERATRDGDGGLVLLERFLGLLGPQGALPAAYTDEAIMRGLRGDDSFPRFLDVFNNRFVQLFFRAWADARPIVQHDRPDDDRFLAYLGSSIGIGSPIYRDLDRIDDRLKLLFAGLTSSKIKSAARLKALITGVFGVKVEVDQCVGTWLHLDKDDQLQLGGFGPGGAGQLGADTIVGAKVYSVSDKIRIRIFTRSLEEYRKFLPPTRARPNPWTEKLFDLIDFYLGLETEYEIELALPRRCASPVNMDRSNSATLGHIGWLKPAAPQETEPPEDLDDEDMLTDTRFRPVRRHTTVYQ